MKVAVNLNWRVLLVRGTSDAACKWLKMYLLRPLWKWNIFTASYVLLYLHSNYCKNECSSYAEVGFLSEWFYVNSTNTETEVLCHTPTCDDATDFCCNCMSSHSLDIQNCYTVGYWVFYWQTAAAGLQKILMCLGHKLRLSEAILVCYPKNQDL